MEITLSTNQCATLACILEATAPKVGNVHRGADFEDLTYSDLLVSAVIIGPIVEQAERRPIGEVILQAVRATRAAVATNSNLGTVLLLAPLAAVPREQPLREGVQDVLKRLTPGDARDVYEAIRTASAGGLGKATQADVAGESPADLITAMRLAEDRDLVARQYSRGFEETLGFVAPAILRHLSDGHSLFTAIVAAQFETMSRFPDSLIARKLGPEVAERSARWAGAVLSAGAVGGEDFWRAAGDLDFWLRSDGNRRNPGTTADLIAAALFALLRDGKIDLLK